jgi:hypothetical protein
MKTVTFRPSGMPVPNLASRCKQHQTPTMQAILQMVGDPNKPGTAENSIK